jgi:hypothetical protein
MIEKTKLILKDLSHIDDDCIAKVKVLSGQVEKKVLNYTNRDNGEIIKGIRVVILASRAILDEGTIWMSFSLNHRGQIKVDDILELAKEQDIPSSKIKKE